MGWTCVLSQSLSVSSMLVCCHAGCLGHTVLLVHSIHAACLRVVDLLWSSAVSSAVPPRRHHDAGHVYKHPTERATQVLHLPCLG
jgi:hypothetical protein